MSSKKEIFSLKRLFLVAAAAFVLNLIWENLHAPLYAGYHWPQFFWICLLSTLGDVFYTLIIYFFYVASGRRKSVAAILGIFLAIFIELKALKVGKWAYGPYMPIIPFIHVGLTPVLQMAILPVVSFKFSERFKN